MTNNKKKVGLTNRERLWKQVNKKIKKIKYTFNPTLYGNINNYDNEVVIQKPLPALIDYDDGETWTEVISNINWSSIIPDVVQDDDREPWTEVISNINWSSIITDVVEDDDGDDDEDKIWN